MSEQAEIIPLRGLRGMIAKNLSQAWQAPRVAQGISVEIDGTLAKLKQLSADEGVKLSFTHAIMRAIALTLKEHPLLNATISDKGITLHENKNISVAVNTDNGLVAPVIKYVEHLSLSELANSVKETASKARNGTLAASGYQGGTFTVSTLGATGIDWFTPVLNPPQVAILGVGGIQKKAIIKDDALAIATCVDLTLVFDHRALDGFPAGLFLSALAKRLKDNDF
jgi:pyruvate dehydrogenase E2 component (dihydrolipoamide acetyltransferase)